MSTLRFNTLQNAAGSKSVPVDTVVDGSAKAWVNFNGTGTVAIRAAFNVSSITDNSTGSYFVNFTTNMPDTDYVITGNCSSKSGGNMGVTLHSVGGSLSTLPAVDRCRIATVNFNGANLFDVEYVNISVFR